MIFENLSTTHEKPTALECGEIMALSRRTLLGLAAAVPVSAALAACGGSSGPGKGGAATYWYLQGQPQEGAR